MLLVAFATLFSSCDSDDVTASITLSQQAVFFSKLGESLVITYTGSNIDTIEIDEDDIPDGWVMTLKKTKREITIYGPTTQEDFDNSLTSSTVSITATSKDDLTGSDYLTVGTTAGSVDLTSEQSNSFVVSASNTIYTFSATTKGESNQTITPTEINILWQTYPTPLSYSRLLDDDTVEFHVAADEDDVDEDGLTDDIIEGNAVIAAYDSDGEILWSWHIWVTDYSIEASAITLNDTDVMSRNLGALNNSNINEESILDSYGLYYQWGRKDPFVGPYYYNAAGASDKTMRNEWGTTTSIDYAESTSTIGKMSYTLENPLTFILGVEDSNYDWLYSAHDDTLWSSTKSINDPCPKGWRVASPELYEGLMIPALSNAESAAIANSYGWTLTDKYGNSDLFMACGRRGYITGKIQNVNLNADRPTPWSGYYWSNLAESSTTKSAAMYFALDNEEATGNEIYNSNYYRSNGMQIRCQRDE